MPPFLLFKRYSTHRSAAFVVQYKLKNNMKYKRLLEYYVNKRLEALTDVDDYAPEKLTLSNLRWFLRHVDSVDVVLAKLRTMVDAGKKRKAYLSRFGVTDDGLEYVEAEDKIGRECLGILQVK